MAVNHWVVGSIPTCGVFLYNNLLLNLNTGSVFCFTKNKRSLSETSSRCFLYNKKQTLYEQNDKD